MVRRIGAVDDAIYAGERAFVTGALLVMSGVVCLNILDQFLNNQQAALASVRAGTQGISQLWALLAMGLAGVALARACWASAPSLRGNRGMINVCTAITVLAFGGLSLAMTYLSSATVTAGLTLACGAIVALTEADRPVRIGSGTLVVKIRVVLVVVGTVVAAGAALRVVPDGDTWTWTQKLALFLLLWTAFIGASMATHDGRHLTIDAVRKSISAKARPYYNAISHAVAAAFTAAFMLLAYWYLQDRLAETPPPGEIPDWLKVLAIPVSLAIVTARFAGRSIGAFLAGIWGLEEEDA